MKHFGLLALGLLMWQNAAPAQTNNFKLPAESSAAADNDVKTGVITAATPVMKPEFKPLTSSERLRLYLTSTFGPGAAARAVASGGIAQWKNSPKEWGGGAEPFGDRIGNAFAIHMIRNTLQYGGSAALREDNRYVLSTDTGFLKRSKHAVTSVFVARNEAGGEHFAYSRFGGALGAAFISRAWQPPSTTTSGDAAVSFGIAMAADMGWNFVKEFRPRHKR